MLGEFLHTTDKEQAAQWRIGEEQEQYILQLGQAIENYLAGLRDVERRIARDEVEPQEIAAEIAGLSGTMLMACAQFEQEVKDPTAIKRARSYFQKRTHAILSKSYAINRCRTWPQGHQGDFLTLESAYRDASLSDGIGYYLDRYLLDSPLARGVRGRIQRLAELLRQELAERDRPTVLDVACGSGRELQDLVPEIRRSGASFTCIDLDNDALNFAMDRLAHADLHPDQFTFVNYNALRLFDLETAHAEFGKQDVIYSVGFFDYLPDEFLAKLLNSLYAMLKPGGKLIAAFKDAGRYPAQLYHWIVDWDGFLQRNEADIERVLKSAGIPAETLSTTRDESGAIIFYTAVRR